MRRSKATADPPQMRCLAIASKGCDDGLRDKSLTQITKDDALVQSLHRGGAPHPRAGVRHPQRSMVLKVLTGQAVEPFFEVREVDVGDRYLICSDGLSDCVPDDAILQALRIPDPQGCPQQLIRLVFQISIPAWRRRLKRHDKNRSMLSCSPASTSRKSSPGVTMKQPSP
jgi:serine/threonine protein phosphatase PrpC